VTSVNVPLLPRVAAGDSAALRECVDRYGALVWSLARRLSCDRDDAEDAAQEGFIEVWRKAGRYDAARASESTFVTLVVRRRLIDRLRARSVDRAGSTAVDELELPSGASATEHAELTDEAAHAGRALETLRPEQRRALELSIYHGLTHVQIADKLRLPLGTVKTQIRTGLAHVRALLGAAPVAPVGEEAQA
jgi:RNA polymerase sigma factor (sigma-70 family)